MGRFFICQAVILFLLLAVRPLRGLGNDVMDIRDIRLISAADTVPDTRKPRNEEKETKKKKPDIIKEVPKTRRKMKPIPIPVPSPIPVKPIKIIKPKVIKRVTGIIR